MKTIHRLLNKAMVLSILLGFMCWAVPAGANLKEIKKYKEAFPDAKPKCINCHVDEKPKKEDGQHDPNDYGKAILNEAKAAKEAKVETTVDTYKKVGPIENFKAGEKK